MNARRIRKKGQERKRRREEERGCLDAFYIYIYIYML